MRERVFVAAAALGVLAAGVLSGQTLPPGFRDKTVFSSLTQPTAVAFSPDGRVFVAEKRGVIKVFASLTATTPTTFADLRLRTYNYWDRGMLGLALHPNFPATPYVYVLYAYDGDVGGGFPKWGTVSPVQDTEDCPSPPGATTDGCTISGRLSRLTMNGSGVWDGTEQVLIGDWFQQFPSHSIGTLMFGPDGYLYATGGDGASFNWADYGQAGSPKNPGGDPPVPVGGTQTPPTAEGGALRSQDLRTVTGTDPVTLSGTLIRIDPNTGEGLPDNPLYSDPDPNAKRILAYGLRNPFRFTIRPGTSEVWIGDVGWNSWEEINRLQDWTTVKNFGWPCYEGNGKQSGYDSLNLNICENLYAQSGAVTQPLYAYNHGAKIVTGESCTTGSSSISGMAFYTGTGYPATYQNALFFADYSRRCIWTMLPGSNGVPSPANIQNFVTPAGGPVQIVAGPGGDLFYTDIVGGKIHRIQYFTPNAVLSANPTSGATPLTVNFDGSASTHPVPGETLTYSWDLNGDGTFGDATTATTATTSYTYTDSGDVTVTLKVSDSTGAFDTDSVVIHVNNTPPVPAIATPLPTLTWKVGDPIAFSGSATDLEDGDPANGHLMTASALSWTVLMHHCPSDCHIHNIQTFNGVASGSFAAPDHEYPSHLELQLTATDSDGLQTTTSVLLFAQTVTLGFASNPAGLQLTCDATSAAAPFDSVVINGSQNTISAPTTQSFGGGLYEFVSWSDGGAATHTVPGTPASYIATYALRPPASSVAAAPSSVIGGNGSTGTVTLSGPAPPSGATVLLSSSNPGVAGLPPSVLIPPGVTSGTFPITTTGVSVDTTVSLTAAYGGGNAVGSLIVTSVPNIPPSVSITSPADGTHFTAPASIAIQVSASDSDGTVARVDYYSGSSLIGSSTISPFGLAWSPVSAGTYSVTAVATDNVGAPSAPSTAVSVTVDNPVTTLPPGWAEQDIGAVGIAGGASYSSGTFTVQGSGTDIYYVPDQFHFVYQQLSGNGEIIARVVSVQNTSPSAMAGVMIRQSLTDSSPYAMMEILAKKTSGFQWRLTAGARSFSNGSSGGIPYWIKLVRAGNNFSAYRSANGTTWTQVGSTTTVNLTSAVYVGLAVTAANNAASCTAVFDNVTANFGQSNAPPTAAITSPTGGATFQDPTTIPIVAQASDPDGFVTQVAFYDGATLLGTLTSAPYSFNWTSPQPGTHSLTVKATDNVAQVTTSAPVSVTVNYTSGLPAPWQQQDIGAVGLAGGATFLNGTFTVQGSGTDIYYVPDQFHYVYQTLNGDGEIIARVVSVQNTNDSAMAGVMIRQSLTDSSPYAMMEILAKKTSGFQWRLTAGARSFSNGSSGGIPYWIKLVRAGNNFSAYRSANGTTWTQVGSTMTVNMPSGVYVGLAVTAHNNAAVCSAVFDNVTKIGN